MRDEIIRGVKRMTDEERAVERELRIVSRPLLHTWFLSFRCLWTRSKEDVLQGFQAQRLYFRRFVLTIRGSMCLRYFGCGAIAGVSFRF